MNPFTDLNPTESMLLINGPKSKVKDLLKITFLDLIRQKVLAIEKVNDLTYVKRGTNYGGTPPRDYEISFIMPFTTAANLSYLISQYVKLVFSRVKNERAFFESITKRDVINPYFKTGFFIRIFKGPVILTQAGEQKKLALENYLTPFEDIEQLIKQDQKKAFELLAGLNGNILLLKNFDYSILEQFDKEILASARSFEDSDYFGTEFMWFGGVFDDWDDSDYWNDFDSWDTYDSSCSSDYSSGCNSCTSCSGCGGCGGCGGCS